MIIVIVGPTGVGKTKLSLNLAKKYNGEIINADSTQVYKEMNIGTAKIKNQEGIVHHLIDTKNLNEEYTIYDFQKEGRIILDDILKRGKIPIIVGGSGLYISALLYDYKFHEENDNYEVNFSDEEMYQELLKLGIDIDKNNKQRLQRKYIKHVINKEPVEQSAKLLYDVKMIGLTTDRDTLYEQINKRVDEMIKEGLIEEVTVLFKKYSESKQIKTAIGYKEFIPFFNGECSLEETINKIKQNSRNYAKRQYTWFNNKMDVKWFETDLINFDNTVYKVVEYLESK